MPALLLVLVEEVVAMDEVEVDMVDLDDNDNDDIFQTWHFECNELHVCTSFPCSTQVNCFLVKQIRQYQKGGWSILVQLGVMCPL